MDSYGFARRRGGNEERERWAEPGVSPHVTRFLLGHVDSGKVEWWSVREMKLSLGSLARPNRR